MEKSNSSLSPAAYKAMLAATILASSMAFIDGTALNVALPVIQRELSLNGTQLLWIVNGYMVFLSALMLTGGGLGDFYGRKRVFITGIGLFSVSSALCGLAADGNWLIAFRCLQGIGAAVMIPGSLALITALVPSGNRGKAIGWWSMFSALTTVVGPILGGWLAGQGLWRVIFFLNIPLALIAIFLLVRYVPIPVHPIKDKLDWPGAILATLMLGGISYGLIEAGESGFALLRVQVSLGIGVVAAVMFSFRQFRAKTPMLPPALFKSSYFTIGNLITALMYSALGGFLFFYPLNLIQVQGYSPELAGLTILPFALLIAGMSWVSGKWVDRTGPRFLLVVGQMLLAIGYFLFALPEQTSGPEEYFSTFFLPMVVLGIGMGMSVVPVTTTVMNSVPETRSGTASGVNNTIARAAQVLAIAVIGGMALSLFQENIESYLSGHAPALLEIPGIQDEFRKMADARLPAGHSNEDQQVFKEAVGLSFITVFRSAALIASILTACGTLITYAFIRRKK